MTESAVVDIVDVVPEAQRVPVYAIVEGDLVFDVFGGSSELLGIKLNKVRGSKQPMVWIKTAAYGLWEPWCFLDGEVTITPDITARLPRPDETQEV